MSITPEGWYRDLNNPDVERYWDGNAWTERTQQVQPSARSTLHPTERYTYDTAEYDVDAVRRVEHVETRPTQPPARSATAVEPERRGFNPLWLLLPLLLLLGLWLGWRALDNNDDEAPAPSTTTTSVTTTTTSATDTASATETATDTGTATGTETGTAITLPSLDEMTTDLTDAGVENAQDVAQAIEDGGPYTMDNLQDQLGSALESANIDNVDVTDIISALGLS